MAKFIPIQGSTLPHVLEFCRNAFNSLNNLTFGSAPTATSPAQASNLGGVHVSVSALLAGHDYAVQHNLNKVPTGYIVTSTSTPAHIYTGVTAWTKNNIYLRSDTVNTSFTVFVF